MDTFADPESIPKITDLNSLIENLHKVFESNEINVDYVKGLLSAYQSNPKDWKKFAKFDQHRYTRNLVDSGNGKFNLMALCWGEQHGSSIHDHSDSHCFVKLLAGDLMETMFEWPDEKKDSEESEVGQREMIETSKNVFHKNEVTYINDSMGLHRMENPSHTDQTVSLHLYCPPFDCCRVFDQRTGHANTVQVTFYSKHGKRTPFKVGNGPSTSSPCCSDAENN